LAKRFVVLINALAEITGLILASAEITGLILAVACILGITLATAYRGTFPTISALADMEG